LVLVFSFGILNRIFAIIVRAEETGVYPDVVLADISSDNNIFLWQMSNAIDSASTVAYFGSEESIRSGMHLQWFETTRVRDWHYYDYYYEYHERDEDSHYNDTGFGFTDDDHDYITEQWIELWTPDMLFHYFSLNVSNQTIGSETLRSIEEEAKRQQLNTFRTSLARLDSISGLYYCISVDVLQVSPDETNHPDHVLNESGTHHLYENTHEQGTPDAYFFRDQPIYFIQQGHLPAEHSFNADLGIYRWDSSHNYGNSSVFLAFSQPTVSYWLYTTSTARDAYIVDFSIIAVFTVLILGLIIVLLIGAGRVNRLVDGTLIKSESVHFSPVDKPYLDISLTVVFFWGLLIVFLGYQFAWYYLSIINTIAFHLLFATMVLLIVPPALIWLMSLSKRLKAGRFWKHTLIYAIIYNCIYGSLRFLFRAARSLWAGTQLTFKVTVISIAAFLMMLFIGIVGVTSREPAVIFLFALLFTAVVTVLLLMYARRIRNLENGARAASEGKYDIPINAGGGELGSIANSINNVSAGINTAVEERMKSERLKTELITNVSHDIRTPLTSIITYTDLLDHEGLDCEKAPEYLDVLKQKSLRLKTLTEELFEAAKAATGNIDVNLTDLNIVSLINQVMGELDNSIKTSGLDLRVNLPEKLLARADGRLMQRVLENLFSNVFKYSLPGSRVYLDAIQLDASQIRIDMKNISSQELNFDPSELTERFKRGDESRSDSGSGLGLSIVQSFMDAQGGKFEVSIDGDLFKATVLLPSLLPIALVPNMNS